MISFIIGLVIGGAIGLVIGVLLCMVERANSENQELRAHLKKTARHPSAEDDKVKRTN